MINTIIPKNKYIHILIKLARKTPFNCSLETIPHAIKDIKIEEMIISIINMVFNYATKVVIILESAKCVMKYLQKYL